MKAKKRKVAECAMRERGRKRACAYTRERAGQVGEAGEQNGNEGGGHRAKERGFSGETREEGKESPQVFDL